MSKDQWDHRFSEDEFVYGESENIFIHNMSSFISAQSAVGCFAEGEGRNAVFLAKEGHHVTAYDQSRVGLEKAEKLARKNNVNIETIAMDLTKEHVPKNQYDAAIMVFGHVPKQDQSFFTENLIDAVKPGGHVLFEVYSEAQLGYQTGGPPSVDMLYHPETVLSWVNQYECLHFYYGEAERHEGKRHHGRCHVIQVVVKK